MGPENQVSPSIKVEGRADAAPFHVMRTHNAVHYHRHAGTGLFPREREPYSLFTQVLRYSTGLHSLLAP